MSLYYQCDECEATDNEPFSFELIQTLDERDDDGNHRKQTTHFCSSACLSARAMTIAMDHREDDEDEPQD